MNISKHKPKGLSAIFLLSLLVTALLSVSVFATDLPTTITAITVEMKLNGDIPSEAEVFTFTLTPDDESYPMPEGINGNTITLQDTGTASFGAITFSEPNTYTYTVHESSGNTANLTYDNTVYKITVYVTTDDFGNLTSKIGLTKNGANDKFEDVIFINSYKSTIDPNNPHTGETSNSARWIFLAVSSASTILLLLTDISCRRKHIRGYKQRVD